jgi:glucose-1-phosphatase
MTKLFVFDLGNVILPFDNRPIAEKYHARSSGVLCADEIFQYLFDLKDGSVNPYEEGLLSSREYFLQTKDHCGLQLGFDEFSHIWNNIFTADDEVIAIIEALKGRGYPIFLLSNTNDLHFSHIKACYPVVHLMDQWILSYEVGAKKPKQRIFDAIFERMEVKGDEVFYVDDVEEYIEAAARVGIKGHVFKNAAALRGALEAMNIKR